MEQRPTTLCGVINKHIEEKKTQIADLFNVYCKTYKKNETYKNNSSTPLIQACKFKLLDDALILSITEPPIGIDVNGFSALIYACRNSMESVALNLINNRADVNIIDNNEDTALIYACQNKLISVALELIKKSSKEIIEHSNKNGITPLMWACANNLNDVAIEIMTKSTNWGDVANNGYTAFIYALNNNMFNVIKKLVYDSYNVETDQQINIGLNNIHPNTKCTPLSMILIKIFGINNTEYPEYSYFIKHCAYLSANTLGYKCISGNGSFMIACQKYKYNDENFKPPSKQIFEVIMDIDSGADKNIIGLQNNDGETALILLIKNMTTKDNDELFHNQEINAEIEDFAIKIIESGYSNPQAKDNTGKSALDYAREKKAQKLIYLLDPAGHVIRGIGQHLNAEAIEELVKYTRGGKKTRKQHKKQKRNKYKISYK